MITVSMISRGIIISKTARLLEMLITLRMTQEMINGGPLGQRNQMYLLDCYAGQIEMTKCSWIVYLEP